MPGTPEANAATEAEPSCVEHWPAGLLVRLRQSAWYTLGQPAFLQETSCPPSPQLKHSSSRSFITSVCDLRFICGRLFSFLDFSSVRLGWLCGWDNVSQCRSLPLPSLHFLLQCKSCKEKLHCQPYLKRMQHLCKAFGNQFSMANSFVCFFLKESRSSTQKPG